MIFIACEIKYIFIKHKAIVLVGMNMNSKIKKYFQGGAWQVLYREKGTDTFRTLKGQKGFWYADPFLLRYDDNVYLFTEAYDIKKQVGKIAVSWLEDGVFTTPQIIIQNVYHMSYPDVFLYNDKVYMLPETGEGGIIELYEAVQFPFKWEKIVLKKGIVLADTTAFLYDGKVFLVGFNEKINMTKLYHLDMSEKKLDCICERKHSEKRFRPAGQLFYREGRLYRPTQNCERKYGGSLIINQVTEFMELKEKFIKEIFPETVGTQYSGMHTYNTEDFYEVIDVFVNSVGVRCFIDKIKRKLHRIKLERQGLKFDR